jgi:hypothetical protein
MIKPDLVATYNEIQGLIRLHVKLASMDGHRIDRLACRFNSMADYAMFTGFLGGEFDRKIALLTVFEAVDSAILFDPMNVPGVPIDIGGYRWMVPDLDGLPWRTNGEAT